MYILEIPRTVLVNHLIVYMTVSYRVEWILTLLNDRLATVQGVFTKELDRKY